MYIQYVYDHDTKSKYQRECGTASVSSACVEASQDLTSNSKCLNAFENVVTLEGSNSDACSIECGKLIVNYAYRCSLVSKLCSCSKKVYAYNYIISYTHDITMYAYRITLSPSIRKSVVEQLAV